MLSATEVVIKIGELAVQYLHEFFGAGDPRQTGARHRLEEMLFDDPGIPDTPDCVEVGARVDWKALEEFVREAVYIRDHPSDADPRALPWLEEKFTAWHDNLNDYHRGILLEKIEALANDLAGGEIDA